AGAVGGVLRTGLGAAGPPAAAALLRTSQATRIAPDGVGADAGGAEGGSPAADYVIDRTWTRSGLHARALELSPPPALDSDGRVARLVLPRRPADLLMLRELSLDRLRVTWWPHRGPRHGINVAVFTSAVSLWRHDPSPRLPALRRARPHHLDQWLLLLSAVIDLPANVSIPSCAARWRWVDFNGTQPAFANVVRLPLRVVEVVCRRRPPTLLELALPPRQREGGRKELLTRCLWVAAAGTLLLACALQVLLLMLGLMMFVRQVRAAGARG
ncbi:unnamed protein product, partial [Prorocentrum cordatum]